MQCEGLKNLIFRDIPYVGHKKKLSFKKKKVAQFQIP